MVSKASFMEHALAEANLAASRNEVPVGAVLVHNGKIIARNGNRTLELKDAVESGVQYYSSDTCHHKPEVYSGILETQCSAILTDFFEQRRK